jgi:rfaE bifunctional protein nucleotidyltransferase chain/domain
MSCREPEAKILSKAVLLERFSRPRDLRLVFTNGVFDLLHRGHVSYLSHARAFGDVLVVGVNTDASARRLAKGPGRPINTEADRALVVAGLECVDAVCLFDEDTPRQLIAELLPDVLVKGSDYEISEVVGREEVEAAGGHVELVSFVQGYSTTDLIQRMRVGD